MRSATGFRASFVASVASAILLVGCGGGSSSSPPPTDKVTLSGVVAKGLAVTSATVTIKGKDGGTVTAEPTDTNGKYTADVSSLTPPFLLKVSTGATTPPLYSVATASGTANITPITDMIIRNWYKVDGQDIDAVFAAGAVVAKSPTAAEITAIEHTVRQILAGTMAGAGVASSFNLLTTPFDANHAGFDLVLDNVQVTRASGSVTVSAGGGTLVSVAENATIVAPQSSSSATDAAPPSTPTNLTATRAFVSGTTEPTTVWLSWNASTDDVAVAGYKVYRNGTQIGFLNQLTYVDVNPPNTMANYTVAAYDATGKTSTASAAAMASAVEAAVVADTQAPTAPVVTATVVNSSQINLSWTAATDNVAISGYKVFVNGAAATGTIAGTTYNVTGLTGATAYTFKVDSIDTSNNFTSSNTASTSTPDAAATTNSAIVGTWAISGTSGTLILAFYADGTYIQAQDSGKIGMERGTYTWNASTGTLVFACPAIDTNGNGGTSGDYVNGTCPGTTLVISVSGNTMSFTGDNGLLTWNRVTDPSNPIVGSFGATNADSTLLLVFFADGRYVHVQTNKIHDPGEQDGLEVGSYTWNPTTGAFASPCPVLDTNGGVGLSSHHNGVCGGLTSTFTVTSTSLTGIDGADTYIIPRVGP